VVELMQLAINVQLPGEFGGLDGKIIYVNTEKRVATKRFVDIYESLKRLHGSLDNIKFLENIIVEELYSVEEFQRFVYVKLPGILHLVPNIKLMVIDSISN
jgi:RecA/RadA recombinase